MRPGELFAQLWVRVEPSAGLLIETPWDGRGASEFDAIAALLTEASEEDISAHIAAYLAGEPVPFACDVHDADQRAFVVMCAIDHAAMFIHPAMPTRLAGRGTMLSPLLLAMKAERTASGCYGEVEGAGLIVPKGHLMARTRPDDLHEASGTDISHQFEYLTLVRPLGQGRRIRMLVPPPHRCDIPADRTDHVGLAPIAEDRDDLAFLTSARGRAASRRPYLDTVPAAPLLGDRIGVAVGCMLDGGAGLVVLPELVTSAAAVDDLKAMLRGRVPGATPALILAGTGPSRDVAASGRPYNETSILTAEGRLLFSQRKLNLFNMKAARMAGCGIGRADGCDDNAHMEDAAAGEELVICDLHGLGRVMVLICEDLEQQRPGGDVAISVRPDWILTPVLDVSQTVGRWTHARAIEIGRKTGSRVVVSCSATLGVRLAGKTALADCDGGTIQTGICFDGHDNERVLFVEAAAASTPRFTVVPWESHRWPRHQTGLGPTP